MIKDFFKRHASTMFGRVESAKEQFGTEKNAAAKKKFLGGIAGMTLTVLPIVAALFYKNDPKKSQTCADVFGMFADILMITNPVQGAAYIITAKVFSWPDSPMRKAADARLEKLKGVVPDMPGWFKKQAPNAEPKV